MKKLLRAAASASIVVAMTAGLSGCSKSVSKSDIQQTIKSKIEQAMPGHKVGEVTCGGDLDATVNASTTCTTTIDGTKRSFKAVVTKVDGSKVLYAIKSAA